MHSVLAYAEQTDLSGADLKTVLLCGGVLAAGCLLAFVPVALAWSGRHRRAGAVLAAAVLWGLVTIASVASQVIAQQTWAREYDLRIRTGYADPQDVSGKPRPPWAVWGVMGAAYGGLVLWASLPSAGGAAGRPGGREAG